MAVVFQFPSRPVLSAKDFVEQADGVILIDAFVECRAEKQRLLPIQARFRPIIHDLHSLNVALSCLSTSMPFTIRNKRRTRTPETSVAVLNRQTASASFLRLTRKGGETEFVSGEVSGISNGSLFGK